MQYNLHFSSYQRRVGTLAFVSTGDVSCASQFTALSTRITLPGSGITTDATQRPPSRCMILWLFSHCVAKL